MTHLPCALDAAQDIVDRATGKRVVVFLDYDGTVTHIVDRPELAKLSEPSRATIQRLADLCTVAIVSGRDRADVARLVRLDSLFYAGSHGFDIVGPPGSQIRHEEGAPFLPDIERAEAALLERLNGVQGVVIERKKYSVAVHYRLVANEDIPLATQAVDAVLAQQPALRKKEGKKVYELQPNIDWNKGRAVQWLLHALSPTPESVLPLYLGDDVTDEDAFRTLRDSGIGIFVGEQPRDTAAQYALRNPDEVYQFLRKLTTLLASKAS